MHYTVIWSRGSQQTALLSVSQQWKPCQQKSEAVNVKVELFMWPVSALFVAVKSLLLILLSTLVHFCFDSPKRVALNLNDPGWPLTLTKTLWIRTVLLSNAPFPPKAQVPLFVGRSSSVSPWSQQAETKRTERRGRVTRTALEQIEAQAPSVFTTILAFNNISSKPTLQTLAGDPLTDFCLLLAHYALLAQVFGFNEHEIAKVVTLLKGTKRTMARRKMHSYYVMQSEREFFLFWHRGHLCLLMPILFTYFSKHRVSPIIVNIGVFPLLMGLSAFGHLVNSCVFNLNSHAVRFN